MGITDLLAAGLLLFGALVALLNWIIFFRQLSGGRDSFIPLLGGCSLLAGALLISGGQLYSWAVPLLDCGTLPFLLGLIWQVRCVWRTSRFNLIAEFTGEHSYKRVSIRLFRKHDCVIRQEFKRHPADVLQLSIACTWIREGDQLIIHFGNQHAAFEALPGTAHVWRQVQGFTSSESSPEDSMAEIDFWLQYRRPPFGGTIPDKQH